jgi:hypothetical protein
LPLATQTTDETEQTEQQPEEDDVESESDESDVEMSEVFDDPVWTDSEPEFTSATTEEDINLETDNLNKR